MTAQLTPEHQCPYFLVRAAKAKRRNRERDLGIAFPLVCHGLGLRVGLEAGGMFLLWDGDVSHIFLAWQPRNFPPGENPPADRLRALQHLSREIRHRRMNCAGGATLRRNGWAIGCLI
jgi:hypothetical protein